MWSGRSIWQIARQGKFARMRRTTMTTMTTMTMMTMMTTTMRPTLALDLNTASSDQNVT